MKLELFGNKLLFLILFSSILQSQTYFDEVSKISFDFYQNVMSPLKNDVSQCQFYPSCSQFSKESFSEFGFLKGTLLTADRFIRCSGGHLPTNSYPKIGTLFFDPPNKNFLFGEGLLWNIGFITSSYKMNIEKSDSSIFSFSKYLFTIKEYESSIIELKRISFYNRENIFIQNKTTLLESINYLKMQNTYNAREKINEVSFVNDNYYEFKTNIINFLINDLENTNIMNVNFLNKLILKQKDSMDVYIKLLLYSQFKIDHNLDMKTETFNLLKKLESNQYINSDSLIFFFKNTKNINYKSPIFAGILSTFIPGAGYIYSGKTKEGLSAFLINGLIGAGIYSLFKNENYGVGIFTSLVATPFYLGNIIGSMNAAHLHNNKLDQIYLLKLRKELGIDYYFSINFLEYCW